MRVSFGRLGLATSTVLALGALASSARAQEPAPSGTVTDIGIAPPDQAQPGAEPAPQGAPAPAGTVVVVQPPAPAPAPKKPKAPEKEWYGWQTLIADGASVVLYAAGRTQHVESIYDIGVATYLLATPIVHVTHGNVGPAFGSLGIRLLVPPVAGGIGFLVGLIAAGNRDSDFGDVVGGGVVGFYTGLLVGIGSAMAIDAFLLAYEKVTPDDDTEYGKAKPGGEKRDTAWFTLRPDLSIGPNRGTAGLRGTF